MFTMFSFLENHKLHKSAHPKIQRKSDCPTHIVLVKKQKALTESLSGNYDGKDDPKNPAQREPLAERV